jgi:glycosyltransferase involved in cell wall biosynthesis
VEHTFFPAPRWLGPFELLYFTLIVNLYGLWRWLCRRPRPAAIIHATCGTFLGADTVSVHFLNCVWAREQLRLGFTRWQDAAVYPLVLAGALAEQLQWRSPWLRRILAVSDSVGEEVRKRTRSRVRVETFPNSYDETRFNLAVRGTYREAMRTELGYAPGATVFCFVSTGHYGRKGFWLAVEALTAARAALPERDVRLLVVGGSVPTVERLRTQTEERFPGSARWVHFAGMQPAVEKYYAASDAFLFPSYFEAFCLAEIEAAACGLPLLLTPHHGSEMILRDGKNGRLLSFDPGVMGGQIEAFIREGLPNSEPGAGRGLTRAQYTAAILATYEGTLGVPGR